ncbi:10968_t:CDS:2, partial [Cetraspora pellucida]
KLVEELVKIFELFEIATEVFSAEKYPMLLVVYSIIEVLKSEFEKDPNSTLNKNNFDKEYYEPKYASFLATLLDSRLKKMHALSNYFKNEAIKVCYKELNNIIINVPSVQFTAFLV